MTARDFNHLRHDIKKLNQIFNLKQIIPFAIRGSNTLDLSVTNFQEFYKTRQYSAPILVCRITQLLKSNEKTVFNFPQHALPSKREIYGQVAVWQYDHLKEVDVSTLLDTMDTCVDKVSLFETIVKTGLDFILPVRSKTIGNPYK